eukprot:TRINITY_DN13813_c0_g1_i1.p1 TRINITY_DN13813_c0_g1~~TRINITY_DN13813_c0_g1_i1.p1  ORF type:complete len:864 (+),score=119.34 TRINITY_DN13813_c0_g1_i1:45-2636(+)
MSLSVGRRMTQRRQLSACCILFAKSKVVPVGGLKDVEVRRYRPLKPASTPQQLLEEEQSMIMKRKDAAGPVAAEVMPVESAIELQGPIEAEVVPRESLPPVHFEESTVTESGLPLIPVVMNEDDKHAVFSLRQGWNIRRQQDLYEYPAALEELFVEASMEGQISDTVLYSTLLECLTVEEHYNDAVIYKETQVRGKLRRGVLSYAAQCTFPDQFEKGRRPVIFKYTVAAAIMNICDKLWLMQNVVFGDSSKHLVARFAARHGLGHDVVMNWLHSIPATDDPTTFNIVLRGLGMYPKSSGEHQHDDFLNEMKRRQIPFDGQALSVIIRSLALKEKFKQLVGLCISVSMRQRIVFLPTVWKYLGEALLITTTPGNAFAFVCALIERMEEEYGSALVAKYPGHPREDEQQWPEYKRGKLQRAILPPRLTYDLCYMLMNIVSHVKEGLSILQKLMDHLRESGELTAHAYSPMVNWHCRHSTVEEVMQYVNDIVLPARVGLQNDVVGNIITRILGGLKGMVRSRGDSSIVCTSARQAFTDMLTLYVDSPRGHTNLADCDVDVLTKLVRLAVYSKDQGAAVDMLRLLKNQNHHVIDSYYIRKVIELASAKGDWRAAEGVLFMCVQSNKVQSSGSSWIKLLGAVMWAHRHRSARVDPFESRASRVIELGVQMVLRGEPIAYADVVEVLRICAARAERNGDELVAVQNTSKWPLGISVKVLGRYEPRLPRMYQNRHKIDEESQQLLLAQREELVQKKLNYYIGSFESQSKMQLSAIVSEVVSYASSRRMTITDLVMLYLVAFWLRIGTVDGIVAILIPSMKKMSQDQARFVDAVIEVAEVAGVEQAKDAIEVDKSLSENTEQLKGLLPTKG